MPSLSAALTPASCAVRACDDQFLLIRILLVPCIFSVILVVLLAANGRRGE